MTTVDWTDKVWTWPAGTREGTRPGQWPAGPWDDEPDKVQWVDPASNLDCLIVRGPMGALCGYVGVSEGHPLFRKPYGDCVVEGCEESHWDSERPEGHVVPEGVLEVHGGLTFSSMCVESEKGEGHGICHVPEPGRPDKVFWFGFDCGHAMDIAPGMLAFERHMGFAPSNFGEAYRDIHYVRENCEELAAQLAGIS